MLVHAPPGRKILDTQYTSQAAADNPSGKSLSRTEIGLIIKLIGPVEMISGQFRSEGRIAAFDRVKNLAMFGERQLLEARFTDKVEMKSRQPIEKCLA